jgi:ribosomal protein S18 acetylase RimI-like enzyme
MADTVRIVPYQAELRRHFYELNRAWIEQYFAMEPPDERALLRPEQEILAKGGAIWFALLGEEVVGTCALKPNGDGSYELTKMAVSPGHQRRGIGEQLIAAAVADFEARSGRLLFLETNAKLGPAMRLYARTGFVRQPHIKPGSEYARSDVYMIYERARAGSQLDKGDV